MLALYSVPESENLTRRIVGDSTLDVLRIDMGVLIDSFNGLGDSFLRLVGGAVDALDGNRKRELRHALDEQLLQAESDAGSLIYRAVCMNLVFSALLVIHNLVKLRLIVFQQLTPFGNAV